MGAAIRRPFKNYNIENRAFNVIEKAKTQPNPAPRYPTEAALEARNRATRPAEPEFTNQRMPELDERLKKLYVESRGDNPVIETKRKLPEDRRAVVDPEFGYMEPLIATSGRIPLRLAVEMINSHKDDPETSSAKNLADKYSLDLETTYLILEYFQPFNLKLPKAESLVGKPHALLKDRKLKQAQKLIAEAEQTMNKSKPS